MNTLTVPFVVQYAETHCLKITGLWHICVLGKALELPLGHIPWTTEMLEQWGPPYTVARESTMFFCDWAPSIPMKGVCIQQPKRDWTMARFMHKARLPSLGCVNSLLDVGSKNIIVKVMPNHPRSHKSEKLSFSSNLECLFYLKRASSSPYRNTHSYPIHLCCGEQVNSRDDIQNWMSEHWNQTSPSL